MFLRGQAGAEAVMTIRTSVLVRNRAGEVSLERACQPPFEQRTRARCNCRGRGTLQRAPHRPSPPVLLSTRVPRAQMGGGIYAISSVLTLQATLLTDNVAPVGATLSLGVGTTAQYLLPAPPGHWVPATKCEIWRQAEADDPELCAMNHTQNVDACQEGAGSAACPLATESQPCNWRKDPSLLGEEVYVLPLGSHDDDALPTPCSIGLLGGNGSDAREQASAKCAGLCPAGFFCAEEATVQPSLCPKGRYCPQGTATPLPCEAGTFGDAAGLSGADQCTPTSPGSYATAGSSAGPRPGARSPREVRGWFGRGPP